MLGLLIRAFLLFVRLTWVSRPISILSVPQRDLRSMPSLSTETSPCWVIALSLPLFFAFRVEYIMHPTTTKDLLSFSLPVGKQSFSGNTLVLVRSGVFQHQNCDIITATIIIFMQIRMDHEYKRTLSTLPGPHWMIDPGVYMLSWPLSTLPPLCNTILFFFVPFTARDPMQLDPFLLCSFSCYSL